MNSRISPFTSAGFSRTTQCVPSGMRRTVSAGTYWWTVLFPAIAIATLVIGVNLVADGLQQVVDQ